jgi:hypothetical protein
MTAPADLGLMERVARESGVDQAVPGPAWSAYLLALLEALARWVRRLLPDLGGLKELPNAFGPAVAMVGIALVAAVLLLLLRALVKRRRERVTTAPTVAAAFAAATAMERDRHGWRIEVERRLAAGDLAGALEALWWWFARGLTAARVDPAWTSGELLAHARRPELAPLALALDRLLYGAQRPAAEQVRGFLGRVEQAVP